VRHPVNSPFARIAFIFARILVARENNKETTDVWNGVLTRDSELEILSVKSE